jgi:RNA polymerase sigma-70 factor (ECF subfamily)
MRRPDLDALLDAAMSARPGLERRAFGTHLGAIAAADGDIAIADLALAFAAAHGDAGAAAELHALVERSARPALAFAGYPAAIIDDAIQETSIQLLVGPAAEARPLLLDYRGRARLAAFIKTIALRTAARLAAINRRMGGDESVLDQLVAVEDPARDVIKAELRPAVRSAYAAAVEALSYVDRELLAAVIVRGTTIDEMANMHGVHRATAARWVGRARAALDEALHRELASLLDLTPDEVSGVLAAIATSIELTPAQLGPARRRRG